MHAKIRLRHYITPLKIVSLQFNMIEHFYAAHIHLNNIEQCGQPKLFNPVFNNTEKAQTNYK